MAGDDEPQAQVAASELRFRGGPLEPATAALAVEVPIALEFNGITHAVMMATPGDLEDFALGFSLSEGILATPGDLFDVEARTAPEGITLALRVAGEAFARLKERRRTLAGRTGCGLCGTESLDQVLRPLSPLPPSAWRLAPSALARVSAELPRHQPLARSTGATHGAAFCARDGQILLVREDVGRHNALDKLVGALARAGTRTEDGFALITSRASVEMVQKAVVARIALLAAVSAPTSLARDTAERAGLTLLGFTRGPDFSIYSHPARIDLDVPTGGARAD